MRRKLVAGNWKMNGDLAALAELDDIAVAAAAMPSSSASAARSPFIFQFPATSLRRIRPSLRFTPA